VANAGAQVLGVSANCLQRRGDAGQKLGATARAAVGEHALSELPDALVGIEFRSVARKADQVKALHAAGEFSDEPASVGWASVPEQVDVAAQVPEQVAEEVAGLLLPNVLEVELEEEVEAVSAGADADRRDGGHPVAPIQVAQDRGLAHRCPGSGDRRCQEEARFVGKDEVGTQPSGVFSTRGQSFSMKRRISPSLRSRARF
jgi:hypothetical protein